MKKINVILGASLLAVSMGAFAAGISSSAPSSSSSAITTPASVAPVAANDISVKNPSIQTMPNGAMAAAVFMELDNKGAKPEFLVAANSPVATQTQLHRMVEQNGVESMRQIDRIAIKPNSDRELQKGGLHVMLMGLKQPLKSGDKVPVTLIFADGSSVAVEAMVG